MARELSNLAKAYDMMHTAMMDLHYADKTDEADAMAWELLEKADLPLLIRARCHMVLSCNYDDPDAAFENAQEAVRLLTEQDLVLPEAIAHQLDEAKRLLKEAEDELAERAEGEEGEEGEGGDTVEVDSEGDEGYVEEDVEEDQEQEAIESHLSGLSAADRLAIKEAMGFAGKLTKEKYGLATPGPSRINSRTTDGPSRRSSRKKPDEEPKLTPPMETEEEVPEEQAGRAEMGGQKK